MASSADTTTVCKSECPLSRSLSVSDIGIQSECRVFDKIHHELSQFGFSYFSWMQCCRLCMEMLGWQQAMVHISLCMFLPALVHVYGKELWLSLLVP